MWAFLKAFTNYGKNVILTAVAFFTCHSLLLEVKYSRCKKILGGKRMEKNRAVGYTGSNSVEMQTIDFPELEHQSSAFPPSYFLTIDFPELELKDGPGVNPLNVGRKCHHGVILKVVATNICGSDQHMVRG